MQLKTRATYVIVAILAFLGVAAGTLHMFSEQGQVAPASMTGGATKSDQRDSTVSNDVDRHKLIRP
jgi:hypothetical protein